MEALMVESDTTAKLNRALEILDQAKRRLDWLESEKAARQRADAVVEEENLRARTRASLAAQERREAQVRADAEIEERRRQRRAKDHENGCYVAAQAIFQRALEPYGRSARAARTDEGYGTYLRCLADEAQAFLPADHHCAKLNYRDPETVPRDILVKMADQLLAGVKAGLRDPRTVAKGTYRMIENKDETGRVSSREWIGDRSFVTAPGYGYRAGRRVINFLGRDAVGNLAPLRY
jgi:hypothetical protein